MPCCGSTAEINVAGNSNIEAHSYTVTLDANEVDTRSFGSGDYGDFMSCAKTGSIECRSYLDPGVAIGDDDVNITTNSCNSLANYTNCVVTGLTTEVDAKGLVEFVSRFRITGDPT